MSGKFGETIRDVDAQAIELRALIPDTLEAFGVLSLAAQAPGALDRKIKELIALAIAVSVRCDACVAYHARAAARAGATRQEVAEALGVAVQTGGGPALSTMVRKRWAPLTNSPRQHAALTKGARLKTCAPEHVRRNTRGMRSFPPAAAETTRLQTF